MLVLNELSVCLVNLKGQHQILDKSCKNYDRIAFKKIKEINYFLAYKKEMNWAHTHTHKKTLCGVG